ncbi:leucine-rich repeat-containing protein 36 isoform X2 [Tachyglossus aculeatus]|uniref:leucine-rich repeat-containing protein 36 isoform X2 n=1 Tax=Tachyglossus aculeatus TaxID=9261 RepID=UPI0018F650CE|nr:leucine-rich repeat-containing protein 36 isoform X2 [Tachyglossus aculeatus]
MAEIWDLDEEGLLRYGALTQDERELVETLSLQGSYAGKIRTIGNAFRHFKSLRSLDLSRNVISSLEGIEYLCSLQVLNLYYNNISSEVEVIRLQSLPLLQELDLRLNPFVNNDANSRLFIVNMLQTLKKLDEQEVLENERKVAKLRFIQLGNRGNVLCDKDKKRENSGKDSAEIEKSSFEAASDSDINIETSVDFLAKCLVTGSYGHGGFKTCHQDGDSARLVLQSHASEDSLEDREHKSKKSVSQSRGGFKQEECPPAAAMPKDSLRGATCSEPHPRGQESAQDMPGHQSTPSSIRISHVASVLSQFLELIDQHWRGSASLLLNNKFLDVAKDMILSLNPSPAYQDAPILAEEKLKASSRRDPEVESTRPLDSPEMLKEKFIRLLKENLILNDQAQKMEGASLDSSSSGKSFLSYDDLLKKNQQLNFQVIYLTQEVARLKKVEEASQLLHLTQRCLVKTNEYLLQQLNKDQVQSSEKI